MGYVEITETSKALGVLGFYVCVLGQISFVLKERLFISDSLLSTVIGIAVGPVGLNWVNPHEWVENDQDKLYELIFQVARIVIGIQVLCAGINLPKAYLRKEWLSLFILLIPIMTVAWFLSSLFIYLLIPSLTYIEALAIGACVTPTDPVLANSIVKGRFAEKHVPAAVRNIISAESGANDGLGFPFIYLAIYIIQRNIRGDSLNSVMQKWVVDIWIYDLVLGCVMGALIGFAARITLKEAEKRKLIDHESFIAYGFGLSFFTLFAVGIIGSDDILACFVCGNVFTWDDWFRVETQDHAFQDVLDSIVNTATFIFIGTLEPFGRLTSVEDSLSPWRLVVIAILIMLFRRLPAVAVFYRWIPALEDIRQGIFAGWFGPIGVSAIYYLCLLRKDVPESRIHVHHTCVQIVFFMIFASVLVHGCTLPLYKMTAIVRRTITKGSISANMHTSANAIPDGSTTDHTRNNSTSVNQSTVYFQNGTPLTPTTPLANNSTNNSAVQTPLEHDRMLV